MRQGHDPLTLDEMNDAHVEDRAYFRQRLQDQKAEWSQSWIQYSRYIGTVHRPKVEINILKNTPNTLTRGVAKQMENLH